MSVTIETITTDLGGFAITKEYSITGAGIQDINKPVNTINVVTIEQDKYRELSGDQVITVAEDLIRGEVAEYFNGFFAVYITSITLLTNNSLNEDFFVSCTANTTQKKVIDYRCYSINPNISWDDNMSVITDNIYNNLYAQLALQTTSFDMETFGVTFHCFNPM
jgi:hypothetical protein